MPRIALGENGEVVPCVQTDALVGLVFSTAYGVEGKVIGVTAGGLYVCEERPSPGVIRLCTDARFDEYCSMFFKDYESMDAYKGKSDV